MTKAALKAVAGQLISRKELVRTTYYSRGKTTMPPASLAVALSIGL
jgi:hypothetical protein